VGASVSQGSTLDGFSAITGGLLIEEYTYEGTPNTKVIRSSQGGNNNANRTANTTAFDVSGQSGGVHTFSWDIYSCGETGSPGLFRADNTIFFGVVDGTTEGPTSYTGVALKIDEGAAAFGLYANDGTGETLLTGGTILAESPDDKPWSTHNGFSADLTLDATGWALTTGSINWSSAPASSGTWAAASLSLNDLVTDSMYFVSSSKGGREGGAVRIVGLSYETTVIPEPASLALLGLGGLGLLLFSGRRRRR